MNNEQTTEEKLRELENLKLENKILKEARVLFAAKIVERIVFAAIAIILIGFLSYWVGQKFQAPKELPAAPLTNIER